MSIYLYCIGNFDKLWSIVTKFFQMVTYCGYFVLWFPGLSLSQHLSESMEVYPSSTRKFH